ncbi:helix-turn-helix domain-containing protein [Flammeovirga yaeyamensis]|uniref:Helix-turn-helix domain-containing protein n=1 Tax=Flammeovirga yaeyamensis TaxID=367791 RepID=A0AAX1ND58_9BACT|nr:helix-turn-helix transcriptional regulator [Flammeovirga yaeyamensis]MBB3696538.1 ribosome-binding protein aMBF1 (putative translation factor) [Flammeovirga yaeyamensis]NMF33217.1 helix-turn-helix transcriptional regulator [Flammeovirga yaeyamensis]QWG05503.1 helix-turn-helix domain-containing protein [Flammeovirga yaeyamensis]
MKEITSFEELLENKYGKKGEKVRDQYEEESLSFRIGVMLKEERLKAKLTQEDLAIKSGTKKSYISRIERGKSDIQISTLQKIIEQGLDKKMDISIL